MTWVRRWVRDADMAPSRRPRRLGPVHGRRNPVRELRHPSAVSPLVHGEPGFALPLTELKRPGLTRARQMIMTASRAAGELSLGPDRKALAQALTESSLNAPGHGHLDH
jgi:hypothetical protein